MFPSVCFHDSAYTSARIVLHHVIFVREPFPPSGQKRFFISCQCLCLQSLFILHPVIHIAQSPFVMDSRMESHAA